MPKQKTKKTLTKRIRITKTGKVLKKKLRTSHLKSKWNTNKRHRKAGTEEVTGKGYKKMFKKLLAKQGKNI
jgi:ribosomal protein L35